MKNSKIKAKMFLIFKGIKRMKVNQWGMRVSQGRIRICQGEAGRALLVLCDRNNIVLNFLLHTQKHHISQPPLQLAGIM